MIVKNVDTTFIQTARRKQILAATVDTIVEIGYAQTSLAEIAKRAGLSKTAIPYYFKTKDELVRHVLIAVFIGGAEYIHPQTDIATDAGAKLATFIRANLAYIATHPREMAAAFDIAMNASQKTLAPLLSPNTADPRLSALKSVFRQGQHAGQFRQFDTHVMAITLIQAIDGVHAQLKRDPALDLAHYAEELVAIFSAATSG